MKTPASGSRPYDGRYTDNDSWSTNKVALDWQGPALIRIRPMR